MTNTPELPDHPDQSQIPEFLRFRLRVDADGRVVPRRPWLTAPTDGADDAEPAPTHDSGRQAPQ